MADVLLGWIKGQFKTNCFAMFLFIQHIVQLYLQYIIWIDKIFFNDCMTMVQIFHLIFYFRVKVPYQNWLPFPSHSRYCFVWHCVTWSHCSYDVRYSLIMAVTLLFRYAIVYLSLWSACDFVVLICFDRRFVLFCFSLLWFN